MINTRSKGRRTEAKAIAYAMTFPNVKVLKWVQTNTRFRSTEQVFDLLVLRAGYWLRIVEIRSNQWGLSKPQTKILASLPGEGYHKQVWMLKDDETTPIIRQWEQGQWMYRDQPWETA